AKHPQARKPAEHAGTPTASRTGPQAGSHEDPPQPPKEQAESTAMQDLGIISPGLEEFRELAGHSRVIPVRLKVLADAETPIGLYRKLAHGQPGTFLMESAAVGGAWSRYSFIGSRSRATLTTKDGSAHWLGEPPVGVPLDGNPVDAIRDTVA